MLWALTTYNTGIDGVRGLFGSQGQRPTESPQGGFSLSLSLQVSDPEDRIEHKGGSLFHCHSEGPSKLGKIKELVNTVAKSKTQELYFLESGKKTEWNVSKEQQRTNINGNTEVHGTKMSQEKNAEGGWQGSK